MLLALIVLLLKAAAVEPVRVGAAGESPGVSEVCSFLARPEGERNADDVIHDRFYWLKIPDKTAAKEGQKIIATVDGQNIRLTGDVPTGMTLFLSDALVDLDQAVSVIVNDKLVSTSRIPRTAATIRQCLEDRLDPPAAATAKFVGSGISGPRNAP